VKRIIYIGNNLSKKTKYTPMLVTLCKLFKKENYKVIIVSSQVNKFMRLMDMARTVIKYRKSIDCVLIDTFGSSNFYFAVTISQIARIYNLPYIPILRGGNLPNRLKKNPFFTKLLFKYSYRNVSPSNFLKVELEKVGYQGFLIPNTIEIENYKFKLRDTYTPKILYVRAFHQIYNPTMAVKVLYEIKKEYPEATLCMIGPPMDSSFEETKQLAKELGVQNSIRYTGVLSKKEWHTLSENYDVFINTTTVDNTPVSVMESMAMGLPVVSTNVGGIPYLLEDKVDAFLVPSNDHKAMSHTIIDIIRKKNDVDKVVVNARKKVELFDWTEVRRLWIDTLNNVPVKTKIDLYDRIYNNSPVFIQNIIISIYGYYWKERRLGGQFEKHLTEFKSRERNTKEEWDVYQTIELRKLLIHAFKTVPFYRELYSSHGFSLLDFEQFELSQLKSLPYLEKDDLRKFGKTTLLSNKKEKGCFFASSGSTGTPVNIYISKKFHQLWNAAYEARVRNWAGVTSKMARGMIGGRRIINSNKPKEPYYRYNISEKQTYFSAYYINENTAENYLNGMKVNKVEYMVGYAMSNYFLADIINKKKLKAPKLKAILTSSEKLTDSMRSTIEEAYQCKVYDAYSGIEACGLISENKEGDFLLSPDTGIMEVIGKNGDQINYGEAGEVIATGLLNYDQPLIRYRIGDRVKLSENQDSKSGLEMLKIDTIEGRVEDVILAKDGSKMVRFHTLFIEIEHLITGQVVQKSLNEIMINLVVEKDFNTSNETLISKRLISQLGEVEIEYQYLSDIPKNKNGKFQVVISNLHKE
jgi:phenylacetate-CoA ligase